MIDYHTGQYGFRLIFRWTGSVFPRVVAVALPCSIACMGLHLFCRSNTEWSDTCRRPDDKVAVLLGGFTAILSFLVVFRSNHAYNRWWEGCTLLLEIRGEWFNAFTSTLAFCNSAQEKEPAIKKFQVQFARLLSLLYNCALQQVTSTHGSDFELMVLDGFDGASMLFLAEAHDRVEIVFQWVQKLLVEATRADTIGTAPPILSRIFNQLGSGMTKVSNARKISEFPIPFPIAQMLTVMLIFHSLFTIYMCAVVVEHMGWAGMLTFVVVGSFFGVNLIAVELEEPFGDDVNDLPLHGFMRDMNDSLFELLEARAQCVPVFQYDPTEHDICATQTAGDLDKDIHDAMANIDGVAPLKTIYRATWATLRNTHQANKGAKKSFMSEDSDARAASASSRDLIAKATLDATAVAAVDPPSTPRRRSLVKKGDLSKHQAKKAFHHSKLFSFHFHHRKSNHLGEHAHGTHVSDKLSRRGSATDEKAYAVAECSLSAHPIPEAPFAVAGCSLRAHPISEAPFQMRRPKSGDATEPSEVHRTTPSVDDHFKKIIDF